MNKEIDFKLESKMTSEEERMEEASFADLLEESLQAPKQRLRPGDRVSGVVVKISKETVFLDLGGKSEGFAEIEEFRDKEGNLMVKEGDTIELRVASLRNGIHLSQAIKAHGAEAVAALRDAFENRIPVEGRVATVRKGGFDIEISSLQAFCPISQIDLGFCEKPEDHVGARYPFRIMEMKERGRNIVVSRRALLQEEQEKKIQELMGRLRPDLEWEGKITKITPYGAFVDLGGVEGLMHVSEISRARIGHPSEVLETGQIVRVKILKIEPEREGRPRISLSMKVFEPEPWEIGFPFQEGDVVPGKVTRLMDFGAFVEVAPGLEGLVHLSEISYERIGHPNKILKTGDEVNVRVLKIDEENRRISLSIKDAAVQNRIGEDREVRLEVGQVLRGIVEDHKPYGLFIRLPQLGMKSRGLLPLEELAEGDRNDPKKRLPLGKEIPVEILAIDEKRRIRLSQRTLNEKEDREKYAGFLKEREKNGSLGTLGDIFKKAKKG
jgi:small subunit ribosomal protein S1